MELEKDCFEVLSILEDGKQLVQRRQAIPHTTMMHQMGKRQEPDVRTPKSTQHLDVNVSVSVTYKIPCILPAALRERRVPFHQE